ncbi:MAG: GGDEF domain-containing protein [Bacilli bacterium]
MKSFLNKLKDGYNEVIKDYQSYYKKAPVVGDDFKYNLQRFNLKRINLFYFIFLVIYITNLFVIIETKHYFPYRHFYIGINACFIFYAIVGMLWEWYLLEINDEKKLSLKKLRMCNYFSIGITSLFITILYVLAIVTNVGNSIYPLFCLLLAIIPLLPFKVFFLFSTASYLTLLATSLLLHAPIHTLFLGAIYYGLSLIVSNTLYTSYIVNIENTYKLGNENKLLHKKLETDKLTKTFSRYGFEERTDLLLPYLIRAKTPVAIFMIDIDFFKKYNDTFGHMEGDKCLQKIADTLMHSVHHNSDFVSRFGGEEFLVFEYNINYHDAINAAERLRKNVEEMKMTSPDNKLGPYVTISVGGCWGYFDKIKSLETFIEEADKNLYISKSKGRNCYVIRQLSKIKE